MLDAKALDKNQTPFPRGRKKEHCGWASAISNLPMSLIGPPTNLACSVKADLL